MDWMSLQKAVCMKRHMKQHNRTIKDLTKSMIDFIHMGNPSHPIYLMCYYNNIMFISKNGNCTDHLYKDIDCGVSMKNF